MNQLLVIQCLWFAGWKNLKVSSSSHCAHSPELLMQEQVQLGTGFPWLWWATQSAFFLQCRRVAHPPNPASSVRLSLDIKLKCLQSHMAPSWSLFLPTVEAWVFSLEFSCSPHILGLMYFWSSQLQSCDWNLNGSLAVWTFPYFPHCFFLNQNLFCEQMFPKLLSQGSSAVVAGDSPGCFHHEYSM